MANDGEKKSDTISNLNKLLEKPMSIVHFLYVKAGLAEDEIIQNKIGQKWSELIDRVVDCDSLSIEDKIIFLTQFKKIKKQFANSKVIVDLAERYINKDADPSKVSDDWYTFFFERAKNTTDTQTRVILANILKSEINVPDSVSRSLIHTISIITKEQLDFFCNIARFFWDEWVDGKTTITHPFIYISKSPYAYKDSNITWKNLKELELLGLVICDPTVGFALEGKRQFRKGQLLISVTAPMTSNRIPTGNVILTNDGQTLYNLLGSEEEGAARKEYREDIEGFIKSTLIESGCSVFEQRR